MNLLECVEVVEETKENSKNALIEKGLEIDESFKLSQVDEKIAEIQSGGGVDWDNPKYMTITPKKRFLTYSAMDGGVQNEIHINIDFQEANNYGSFAILTNNIRFKIADENSNYSSEWKTNDNFSLSYSTAQKKISFEGTDIHPAFFIVFSQLGNITDIAKIDVYNV